MTTDAIIVDLSREVAKMFIEINKEKYKSEKDFPNMVADYFKAYSTAYTILQNSKQ